MNKKILIGSIIAVAILVLVSFTCVVGYQTNKVSTIAKATPLFTVRSSRAIDEESKGLNCDYIGKGKEKKILFPTIVNIQVSSQKIINRINKMNEITFNRFIWLVVNHIFQNGKQENIKIRDIIGALHQLRAYPGYANEKINIKNDNLPLATILCQITLLCTIVGKDCTWIAGGEKCVIDRLLWIVEQFVYLFLLILEKMGLIETIQIDC